MFYSERFTRITVVFVVIAFISTQGLAAEAATTILTKCEHIYSTMYLNDKDDLLAGIRFTTVPLHATSQSVQLVPGTIMVMNHLPRTDQEYGAIFGKTHITSVIRSEIKSVSRHDRTPLAKDATKSFADMIGVHLKNRAENIIVLIGHNKGGDFVFRDGSHKEISGIVEACAIAAKICIFLSCYSKQYLDSDNDAVGVIHALTFLEALSIASKFKARLASQPSERHSVYTIAKYLGKEEVSAKRHSRVRFLVLKGSGTAAALTGVAILIAFLDDEDDKKEWSRPWHWREQT